jgi:glutaryl-CoA dehydrogenase
MDVSDPLQLDGLLTEEERMIRDTARSFCSEKLAPQVRAAFRGEKFDRAIMREMGDAGLLGATVKGYGCVGASYTAYGLVAREVERIDSGYRSAMSVQSSLVMHPIYKFGSSDQKEEWLPRLVRPSPPRHALPLPDPSSPSRALPHHNPAMLAGDR